MSQPIDRAHVEVVPDIDKFLSRVQKDLDKAFKNAANDINKHVDRIEKDFRKLGNDITKDMNRAGRDGGRQLAGGIKSSRNDVQGALKAAISGFVLGPEIQLILRQIRANILVGIAGVAAAASQALVQAFIPLASALAGSLAFIPGLIASFIGTFAVIKTATSGVGDAIKALEKGGAKLKEALDKLAPSARAFVLEIKSMRKELKPVQLAIQQAFFSGVSTNLSLISGNIAALRPILVQVATAFNGVFFGITRLLGGIQGLTAGRAILSGIRDFVTAITPGVLALTAAFLKLAGQAGQFGTKFGTVINQLLTQFAAFLSKVNLADVIENISTAVQTFVPVFRVLGVVFGVINQVATAFRPALAALGPAFAALGKIVANVAIGMGPGFAALIKGLAAGLEGLAPAALPFGKALGAIGTALGPIVAALGPAFANVLIIISTAVSGLLTLLQPFIVIITKIAGTFAASLTPVLTKLAATAMPLITKAARQILAAFMPMIPIITRLATQFATKLLPPLIKLATTFLTQVLPEMVKFAEIVAPAVIQILTELEPHIPAIVQALVAMVRAWITIQIAVSKLLPVIAFITVLLIKLASGAIKAVITTARVMGRILGTVVRAGFLAGRAAVLATIAVVRTASRVFMALRSAVTTAIRLALSVIRRLPGQIRSAFSGARSWLLSAGRAIISGLISGIRSMAGSAAKAAVNAVKGAINAARSALKIGSPSKVAADEIGVPMGQGITVGFDSVKSDVANALAKLALPKDILSAQVAPTPAAPANPTAIDMRELAGAIAKAMNGMEWRFADIDKVVSRSLGKNSYVMRRA